ncbi:MULTISPECIES: fibronectin type III domain-containing protein [Bacillus cereus group]|uniref:fibronectin type III domain-containing protein n=1 Tax=Bacillus cereus group TaxID=86661 RepID=UPI000BF2AFE1|nr:fibronectin type III domain-containing protein [Bacillus thuringiensis]PFS77172.1 hypothetical protein COK50_08120 [Bacillus thuringiensis]
MTVYTVNQPGNKTVTFPSSFKNGDTLVFNNTSSGPIGEKIQWKVPADGVYMIDAWGAQGGGINNGGGKGARMKGEFKLSSNQYIDLLVGQQGEIQQVIYPEGGGGGASMVYAVAKGLLMIAGGGGGVSQYGGPIYPGYGGEITGLSSIVDGGLPPSQLGNGGTGVAASNHGGGGGGYHTQGIDGKDKITGGKPLGGSAYGGTGWTNAGGNGGYGGGGGCGFSGGGGGGGYTGGNSAQNYRIPASGGGSYNIGENQSNTRDAKNGHGRVEITLLRPANEPPTKPTLTKQPISNSVNLSNDTVRLEWNASNDPEGNPITYEIDFYNGSTWVSLATKITDTKCDCIIPSVATDKAQFRVRATDSENGASKYSLSNVFIVAKQLYVINDGDIHKSYKNGNWESI